jgi:hypothetical protein
MAFGSYSTTPASNTTIGGISIAEGCPAGNVNNAIRQLMADGRELNDTVAGIDVSSLMPKSGGEFVGEITRALAGGYRYNAAPSQINGATYFLPTGSARPTAVEGVVVFYY